MSQENLERTRTAYEAFNARDQGRFLALMDAEVGMFPDYEIEIEELRDFGEVTISRFRARGHGAASGAPLVDPAWHAIRWRNEKCVWWRVCLTEAEALEAAGLSD